MIHSSWEEMMKLNGLAKQVGKSAPYVMVLQKKFGLPACKDYPDGLCRAGQKADRDFALHRASPDQMQGVER